MKVLRTIFFWVLAGSLPGCMVGPGLFAQVDTGSVAGTVTDTSGATVPNATVTAVDAQSGTKYTAITSSSGSYTLPSMRPGSYTISATASGFSTATATGVTVNISTRVAQDLKLPLGTAAETVQVNANALALETESSDIGTVISSREVEELPLAVGGAFRSFSTLAFLTPGAVGPGTNGGTTYTKIGGGQTEGSDFLIDGISTLRSENGTAEFDQTTPAVEAVQEFRVETLSLPAYLGRSTGGLANFKTRSGSNEYHGVIFDFFKNAGLDANDWFNNGNLATATAATRYKYERSPDTKNDYGITLGGPVAIPHLYNGRDKTFFFFDWEQLRYASGGVSTLTVPTLAQRSGDFSSTLGSDIAGNTSTNPCTGQVVRSGQIFDPNTTQTVTVNGNQVECRTPFTDNQIPIGRSAVATKVLSYIPEPNYVGSGTTNYSDRYTDATFNTVYSLRLDQNLGLRHHVFFFGSARENTDGGSVTYAGPTNSGNNVTDQYYKYLRAGWDVTLTPNLVNSLTVGINRVNSFNISSAAESGTNWDSVLGIPNTDRAGVTFPIFSMGEGTSNFGSSNYDDNIDTAFIGNDDVNLQRGRHSFRVGGTVRYQQFSYENSGPQAGDFSFGRSQTAGTNDSTVESQSGNGIASFLLGVPSGESRSLQVHYPQWRSNYYGAYVQDDWKARRNLTLNLGVRWELDTPRHDMLGDTSALNPTAANSGANGIAGALAFGGVGTGRDGNISEQWANNYYKNFGPRIGFSYAPDIYQGKVVIRGAYSILYGPLVYSDYGQGLSHGFTVSTGASTTSNGDGFLPYGQLDDGPNPLSYTLNTDASQLNGQGIDYVAKSYGRPATVQNTSLEMQTELAPDFLFTVGYLRERGTHLRANTAYTNDINASKLSLGNILTDTANSSIVQAAGINLPYANFFNDWSTSTAAYQEIRPFPQYGYITTDSYIENTGQSTYDALEVKLQRRFHNGLTLLSSYTWSKTFTDADSIQPYYSVILGQGGVQNPYDLKAEKAVSTQDVPTNFVVSYLYDLPVGRGKKLFSGAPKVVDQVIGGWRVGGIQRYLSGQPISFFGEPGIPGFYDNGIRPNRVAGVSAIQPADGYKHYNPFSYVTGSTSTYFWNPAAFQNPNLNRGTGAWQFGNMPRNSGDLRSPAFANEDFNLSKTFPIHEQVNAEFRLEAFDAFNRHVFSKPDSGVTDTNFGQISGTNSGPRNLQLVLRIHY